MPSIPALRSGLAAVALAALAAACAEPPPPVITPPPPPPAISLSASLVEEAAAYRRYMDRATAIQPSGFADGPSVAQSLEAGVAYEPSQLVRGAIAYAAVVALQDRAFVEGVRAYAKNPESRRQVAFELMKDPAYAVGLPNSAAAAGLVIAALGGDGQRLYDGGKAVKQSAYDIQKAAWSKGEVPARDVRLTKAKTLSSSAMLGDTAETTRLQQAIVGAAPLGLTAEPAAPPYTPTVVRGLAVAALAALGEAGDANLKTVMAMTAEPNISTCMGMSKLNLYQCLAVARPHYEDVFCLGQHAMMDTARCVIRASGLPEPYEPRFVPSAESINKGMPTKKKPAPKKTQRKG